LPTAIERTEFEAAVKAYLQRMQPGPAKRSAQKCSEGPATSVKNNPNI
jgi:hypothetical protein